MRYISPRFPDFFLFGIGRQRSKIWRMTTINGKRTNFVVYLVRLLFPFDPQLLLQLLHDDQLCHDAGVGWEEHFLQGLKERNKKNALFLATRFLYQLHYRVSSSSPLQYFPPSLGGGFVHVLVLRSIPFPLTFHHAPQSLHSPSIE